MSAGAPSVYVVIAALLYSLGAHGIMTLNDFKALVGDRKMGVKSLPVMLGPEKAARVACLVMALPQVAIIALLASWDRPLHALGVAAVLALQILAMRKLLRDPKGLAPWYNGTGVTLYVGGMLITAFAIRTLGGAG
jgi:chlorophyll synthase